MYCTNILYYDAADLAFPLFAEQLPVVRLALELRAQMDGEYRMHDISDVHIEVPDWWHKRSQQTGNSLFKGEDGEC